MLLNLFFSAEKINEFVAPPDVFSFFVPSNEGKVYFSIIDCIIFILKYEESGRTFA